MSSLDDQLLALLAEQRRKNAAAETTAESQLPDLDPTMLLSAAGRSELQNAEAYNTTPWAPPTAGGFSTIDARNRVASERPQGTTTIPTAPAPTVDLTALFMTSEAAAQAELSGEVVESNYSSLSGADDDFPIQFADEIQFSAEDIPGTGAPNESVRFQLGREAPRATPFYSREVHGGRSDGQVVSRIGSDGHFHPTEAPTTMSQPPRPVVPAPRSNNNWGSTRVAGTRTLPTGPAAAPPVDRSSIPSKMQRLMKGGLFDD